MERRAKVRRTIIGRDVRIPRGFEVGWNHELDRARGLTVTDEGVTVVAKSEDLERFVVNGRLVNPRILGV